MRAAVIRQSGATPALDQFADPQPGQGLSVCTLVAAALNPLDIAIVNYLPIGSSTRRSGRSQIKPTAPSQRHVRDVSAEAVRETAHKAFPREALQVWRAGS